MNRDEYLEKLSKGYGFLVNYGFVVLYGNNIKKCAPYLCENKSCVEDYCEFCKSHGLKMYYGFTTDWRCFFEYFIVNKLIYKYSVNGSKKEFLKWIDDFEKQNG